MAFEYRRGTRMIIPMPLDSSAGTIEVGTAITESGATSGYVKAVDATSEAVLGVAFSKATAGAADGDVEIMVDVSTQSTYEVAPTSGSIAQAQANKLVDVGANGTTVDITASTTDDLEIIRVDVDNNKAEVRIRRTALSGVV